MPAERFGARYNFADAHARVVSENSEPVGMVAAAAAAAAGATFVVGEGADIADEDTRHGGSYQPFLPRCNLVRNFWNFE